MKQWLNDLVRAIDAKDTDAFVAFLNDDALFRFANAEPVHGRDAIRAMLEGFFASIRALSHTVRDVWEVSGAVVMHGEVTYTRHDGSTLSVPFANVFKMRGEKIAEYLIYVDASGLYA